MFLHAVLVALCHCALSYFSQYFTTFVKQLLGRSVCKYMACHCVILDLRRELDKCSLLSCYAASRGRGLNLGPIGCREPSVTATTLRVTAQKSEFSGLSLCALIYRQFVLHQSQSCSIIGWMQAHSAGMFRLILPSVFVHAICRL